MIFKNNTSLGLLRGLLKVIANAFLHLLFVTLNDNFMLDNYLNQTIESNPTNTLLRYK